MATLRDEFRLHNFGFKLKNHKALSKSQWEWHPVIFLVYRFIVCGYTLGYWIAAVVESTDKARMGIYLTHWTYTMLTLHFLVAFIVAVISHVWKQKISAEPENPSEENTQGTDELENRDVNINYQPMAMDPEKAYIVQTGKTVPWYMMISWVLYDVTLVFSIIVTLVYFGALYDPNNGLDHYNLNRHALNSVIVIIDFAINATPVRLYHIIYPIVYGSCYVIFTLIYWSLDKDNNVVYSILNYNSGTLWEMHPVIFLVYRFIVCGYTLGYWIAAVVESTDKARMGIYLTHWTYTMLTLHFLVAFIIAVISHVRKTRKPGTSEEGHENTGFDGIELESGVGKPPKPTEEDHLKPDPSAAHKTVPWYMIISWILFDVSLIFTIIVTGIYFGAVYNPENGLDHYNINRHAINSILMVIDFALSGTPVRILHMLYPMIYGLIYIIFNVSFWSFDKENNIVYSILNYNPKTLPVAVGVILGLLIVGIPLLKFIYYALFRFKRWIYFKIHKKEYERI
ncbi:unnamed protein product [Owenia fusiformis]|uniref:Protein rolling stone n=1 Tax=Owenia fusiformis TaxID=6347 RepID=A0A8S4P561_OWEFU|nr:unnamed protein product [Owenia fusiformis]